MGNINHNQQVKLSGLHEHTEYSLIQLHVEQHGPKKRPMIVDYEIKPHIIQLVMGNCLDPLDFQVVEMGIGANKPLILGRVFLATVGVIIDIYIRLEYLLQRSMRMSFIRQFLKTRTSI